MWEITSSRCYLASYVSRSLPASADGALLVADFAPNSATMEGPRCCNGACAVVGSVGYLKLEIDHGARVFGCIEMSELRLILLEKRGTFRVIV